MMRLEWARSPKIPNLEAAQAAVDSEALRRCEPYVPMDTGELIRSGVRETRPGSGQVRYRTPYARRWYYEPARFQMAPFRGNLWFHRMLGSGGRAALLNTAARLTGARRQE